MNQRLISRELLPRLPSCQPGASQPCPGETGAGLRIVAWRGNYLLSRHSIYRYLQQHCVIAETHHSQLSAAREVGKITAPLSISFSRSEDQDCVLFSSCHCTNTDITKPRCAITCSPQCDGCGVECAILGPLVAGGCTCLQFPEPRGVSRPWWVQSANIALLRLPGNRWTDFTWYTTILCCLCK